MLQSLLRRLLLEKCEERERSSPGESLDDTEVVLRRNHQLRGRRRQRVTSCPDPSHLQQIHMEGQLGLMDLRRSCEDGGHHQTSLSEADNENLNEDNPSINFFTEHSTGSCDIFEPKSSIEQATVERLAAHFDRCVEEAVTLVLSLPDGDYKQDMLHSLEYQLGKLKQTVTENCHAVIFSMLVKVE